MNNINKITEGNAFAINIRQAVWRTLGGVIQPLQASELVDVHLYVGSGSSKSTATEYPVTADGDTISAVMPATLKRGVYRTWLTALYQGREVASACECAFEIVPFDERKGVFAPERIDGEPCVYLQGVSMSDAELEAQKTYYRALIKQKEDEIALLAKEREKLTNVAMQLDGVDESLDGITETLDGVAKEDTQQEIKKALDLVKAEISVEDKLNIRAAIELKGGQSVYKNPENPALLELAKNVGTIPQKFMTLEPEGVRYDDPIEWSAFNADVAYAVSTAKAFQNRIDAEDGIPSVSNPENRYKGFVLFRIIPKYLAFDNNNNAYKFELLKKVCDAYMIQYANYTELIEFEPGEISRMYYFDLNNLAESDYVFLYMLFNQDDYTLSFDKTFHSGDVVVGGHPILINITNSYSMNNCLVQLNYSNTNFSITKVGVQYAYLRTEGAINISAIFLYVDANCKKLTSNRNVLLQNNRAQGIYIPGVTKLEDFNIGNENKLNRVDFSAIEEIKNSSLLGCAIVGFSNLKKIGWPSSIDLSFNGNLGIDLSNLEIITFLGGGSTKLFQNLSQDEITLPKLKSIDADNGSWGNCYIYIFSNCNIKKINLPNLEALYAHRVGRAFVTNGGVCYEIYAPKLRKSHSYDKSFFNTSTMRKITVGNINELDSYDGLKGCLDLIQIRFAEELTNSQKINSWQPSNAINANISTLVEEGEEFANNREKFLWNFRNYIIAMLHDYAGTGETRTLTLHSMVTNVLTDEDKLAITNKGWILSIV